MYVKPAPADAMTLNRETLAKIDRRLLSQLNHGDGVQLVKVPVSDAVWSTWRRYCEGVGVPMGRALALLLHRELGCLVDEDLVQTNGLLQEREDHIASREQALALRERELATRGRTLAIQERQAAQSAKAAATQPVIVSVPKLGRNEPCLCGSGKKYKYCHGRI